MLVSSLQTENALLVGQKRVLEMVARGAPLAETLTELAHFIEAQEDGLRCGVLIVTDDGAHFRRGGGPRLPEDFLAALDGVPIAPPYLGPCGQAAYEGVPVVVPDIAGDSRWADQWRDLALSCGLAACRSTPVRASDGQVLASFAMYYDHPRDPYPAHPQLIDIAIHLASIALERKQAEERNRLLIDELNHRVKNTLATVQSVAAQTFRNVEGSGLLWGTFEARLMALSNAHNLLTSDNWQGVSLLDLVRQELLPHCGETLSRCRIEGGEVQLRPKIAIALGMVLHELTTNAAKHGALSAASGKVSIAWQVSPSAGGERLRLTWTERGGPAVEKPRRKGFGSRLIEKGLALELNGEVQLAYEPAGVCCFIDIPLAGAGDGFIPR